MMNKPQTDQPAKLEFLSPAGQRRYAAMLHELSAELPEIQTQRRTRRRRTFTAGTAILLVAITTGALKLNRPQPGIANRQQSLSGNSNNNIIKSSAGGGAGNGTRADKKTVRLETAANQSAPTPTSYITRTAVEKSTRWTHVSTAAVQADHAEPRTQRVESDDELLQLLQQAGYKSVGLIRTENRIIISGNTTTFKTAKPTARPPVKSPVPTKDQDDESKTGQRTLTSGIIDFNA